MYQWAGPVRSPGGLYAEPTPPSLLKFIHLLHLSQAVLGSRMRLMAGQDRADRHLYGHLFGAYRHLYGHLLFAKNHV